MIKIVIRIKDNNNSNNTSNVELEAPKSYKNVTNGEKATAHSVYEVVLNALNKLSN